MVERDQAEVGLRSRNYRETIAVQLAGETNVPVNKIVAWNWKVLVNRFLFSQHQNPMQWTECNKDKQFQHLILLLYVKAVSTLWGALADRLIETPIATAV